MTKRGRKRVERRWGLYVPDWGTLDEDLDGVINFSSKEEAQRIAESDVNPTTIPVHVTISWEEPPRKEKR